MSLRVRGMLTNEVETYHLNPELTTIGRAANVILQGEGLENVHALIKFNEVQQVFYILDVNTCHGTFVNQEKLDLCFRRLNSGDTIQFGKRENPLTFLVTSSPPCDREVITNESKGPMTVDELNDIFERASQMCSSSLEKHSNAVGEEQKICCPQPQQKSSSQRVSSQQKQQLQQGLSLQQQQQQQNADDTCGDGGPLSLRDLQSEPPSYIGEESLRPLLLPPSQARPSRNIKETLQSIETQHTVENLLGKVDEIQENNAHMRTIIRKMEDVLRGKDESLRIMAKAAEKTRKENACLEIQNEALLNSVARKYADCDGCRREDLMIQKDMEIVKLRVQLQIKTDKMEELKKCTECLHKELERLKHDNAQLKKCLKSADDDITEARKSSEQFQRAEMLGRVNIERMLKQLDLLKKPVLEMVNVFCSDESSGEAGFPSIENLCQFKGMPLTSTPLPSQAGVSPNELAKNEKRPSKGTAEGNKINGEWTANQCLEYGLAQVPIIDNTDSFIKAADECVSKMKKLKCQKQLSLSTEAMAVDQKQPLAASAPAAINLEKKDIKRKKK